MKVSIIMNCYNSERYLREAIDSIYRQTYDNWEIIFWDNQSTDASAEIAKSYGEKLNYYCADRYLKLGEGRNKALEQVTGDLIAFLDCDDQWVSHKLERQVSEFMKNPDISLCYSNYYDYFETAQRKELHLTRTQPSGRVFSAALRQYPVGILTAMMRSTVLQGLDHYFDPELNLCEDYDFFMRIILDHFVSYIHEPLALYRIHNANLTTVHFEVFPDEQVYCLEKFKVLAQDACDLRLIDEDIARKKLEKIFRSEFLNHRYMAFFKGFFKLSRKPSFKTLLYYSCRYVYSCIKSVLKFF